MGVGGSLDRTLSNARRLAKKGDALAAHALYSSILSAHPANVRAAEAIAALRKPPSITLSAKTKPLLNDLSLALRLLRAGQAREALAKAARHAGPHGHHPLVPYTLGMIFSRLEDHRSAIGAFRQAIAAHPPFADARMRVAKAYANVGDRQSAITELSDALAIDPTHAPYAAELGRLLGAERRTKESLAVLDIAATHAPDDPDIRIHRGAALSLRGAHAKAIADHEKAVALAPGAAAPALALATTMRIARRHAKSEAILRDAIAAHPNDAGLWNNLGVTLSEWGDDEAALAAFEKAATLDPAHVPARVNLALWTKGTAQEANVTAIERMLAEGVEGTQLHFALGKALDDLGEYDRAYTHFAKGNAMRRARLRYSPAAVDEAFSKIREQFAAEPLPAWTGATDDGPTPIFIVGMPRSGSSLGEYLLAAHSQVEGVGEANAFKIALEPMSESLRDGEAVTQTMLGALRRRYRNAIAEFRSTSPMVLDKELSNFRWIGFIASAFPESKIIWTRRDRMATAWSIFNMYFSSGGHNYSYSQEDIVHYFKIHDELMAFWQRVLPERIYTLDYEALTSQPEKTVHDLLDHCGLAVEPQCLNTGGTDQIVATASGPQVRQGIYKGSSEKWRRYERHLSTLTEGLTRTR
ncbi:MAG: sulfotransferase [Pseudomonadota bacterium]